MIVRSKRVFFQATKLQKKSDICKITHDFLCKLAYGTIFVMF